ncbi:hypothetical protein Taro_046795 [Colocasia esculenta]|uniref:Putative E3 ubiquitin-protein ligase LIN N-terminal domain-containing protein n=1 Tax=Colocasia esculenta TaxID=4460 RepID=A0A843WQZ3_COLES|nr:hypothetical protein [Colocasia esculenta]
MASLQELLADDGFKKREPRPEARLLQGFADGEREFGNRAISMPLIHHGHGKTSFLPSADPRPGEVKTRASKSLPRRKSPAVWSQEDVKDMPGFNGGNFNAKLHSRRPHSLKDTAGADTPLDEAATRALISILNDHIRWFFEDENFRLLLRQKCYYCVRFRENGGEDNEDDGGAKLGDAIKVIDRSVQEFPDPTDLKRSHAQLSSIITGPSTSSDQRGGFTSGVSPRSRRLSACVHLYLSIIYKMMKKDTASAEHLLQVFCDAPFEARSILLRDLWGSLLLPHLRHLKAWYVEEAEGVSDTPCRGTKIKLLKRVYSDSLDKGTYQIAAYYKGWVRRRLEAPSYPSVCVPSPSLFVASKGGSGSQLGIASPRSPASSSRPLISKKLYESIFDRSREQDVDSEQDCKRMEGELWDEKADETGH